MKNTLFKIGKYVVGVFALLTLVFIGLVGWRMSVLEEQEKVKQDVAAIHDAKLKWDDINGELPSIPDPEENNNSLTGVDSNQNGIRDDVEIAIYEKYKTQPRLAIGMLQYAKALQKEFTHVYNSETLVAVIQKEERAAFCVFEEPYIEETRELVFNNAERKQWREEIRNKFMTSYTLLDYEACDLEF